MTTPTHDTRHILNADAVQRAINRIARDISQRNDGLQRTVLIGIQPGGVALSRRIAAALTESEGQQLPEGMLDATLYCRDVYRYHTAPPLRATSIPVDLNGYTVVLVNDVLHSGRVERAAVDAVLDMGFPALIQLAVLIDLGQHEMPIRADFVGKRVPLAPDEHIQACIGTTPDATDAVLVGPAHNRNTHPIDADIPI